MTQEVTSPDWLRVHAPPDVATTGVMPAVLLCAWRETSFERHPLAEPLIERLVTAGTLVGELDGTPDELPDVDRAAAAFRTLALRDGVDLSRLSAVGISTGALVVSGVAPRIEGLAGIVLIAPLLGRDLMPGDATDETPPNDRLEALRALDGPGGAAAGRASTLVIDAAADRVATPRSSREYVRALENAGVVTNAVRLPLSDHDISGEQAREATLAIITDFLKSARHVTEGGG